MRTFPRALVLLLCLLAISCGGTTTQSGSLKSAKRGSAVLNIIWPTTNSRLIPNATSSLLVSLSIDGQALEKTSVTRPSGTTTTSTTFNNLPYGDIQVVVSASAQGPYHFNPIATGSGTMTVSATQGSITVSLVSTVSKISVATTQDILLPGKTETLNASATDGSGNMVLLSSAAGADPLTWKSSASSIGTVAGTTPAATLTGVSAGYVNISASSVTSDSGATVTGSIKVWIGPKAYLANGGYPKTHGDLGNSGTSMTRVIRTSASEVWKTNVGSGPITALVADGSVYAASGGTVTAISNSGTTLWTHKFSGTVSGLLMTQDGQLLVGASSLNSLSISNGQLLWSFATDSACMEPNVSSDGMIIYATTKSSVYAINPAQKLVWRYQSANPILGGVSVTGDMAVVWTAGALVELNPDGTVYATQMPKETGGTFPCLPCIQTGNIFYIDEGPSGSSLIQGTFPNANRWTFPVPVPDNSNSFSVTPLWVAIPSSANGTLTGYDFGYLDSFNLFAGDTSSPTTIQSDGYAAYTVANYNGANSLVYFDTDDPSKGVLWSVPISSQITVAPAANSSGYICLGDTQGNVTAVY